MVHPVGPHRRCSGCRLAAGGGGGCGGQVEADLGGGLFKKRVAREGSGKRRGYRVLIGYKKPHTGRIVFLYAFAKNTRANISDKEKMALSLVAEALVSATEAQIRGLIKEGSIVEVQHHE
jgi:hypothetical protein